MPKRFTKQDFIDKSVAIHGDRFDYSLVDYKNMTRKVDVVCRKHGVFSVKPAYHAYKYDYKKTDGGCPKCKSESQSKRNQKHGWEHYLKMAIEEHGDRYNYDEVNFKTSKKHKVKIYCNACQDYFMQTVNKHAVQGQGCPTCRESRGEKAIAKWLDKHQIYYERQWAHPECKNIFPLPFDFKVGYDNLVEFDGEQHFIAKPHWGGEEELGKIQKRDRIKTEWAKDNGYNLFRLSYKDEKEVADILEEMVPHLIRCWQ